MKSTVFLSLVAILLLVGCKASTAGVTQPPLPSATSAPIVTEIPAPTLEPTLAPSSTPTTIPEPLWLAYVGNDGNIALVDRLSAEIRPVTSDGTPAGSAAGGQTTVHYSDLKASSDGQYLAFRREVGTPVDWGYSYAFEVWVYRQDAQESQRLLTDISVIGMDWRPGTPWLTFAMAPDEGYFAARGQVDSSKAKGIWAVNVESDERLEWVPPENGLSLRNPQWSPDGRYLAFEEIWGMEGSGYFAYYRFDQFDKQDYGSWGEAIGSFDWSPDSERIAYDTLTYIAAGSERVFLRSLDGEDAQPFSPDLGQGYAFGPRFSPSGNQLAYLANLDGPDNPAYTLFVQQVDGSEPHQLGNFEYGGYLSWLPDESGLILSGVTYGMKQIFEVSLSSGEVRVLADGDMPVLLTSTSD